MVEKRKTSGGVKSVRVQKRARPAAGDTFAIPLGAGYFVFGRVMEYDKSIGALIEIFRCIARERSALADCVAAPRLFAPIYAFGQPFENSRWEVLGKDPLYSGGDLEHLEFVMGDRSTGYRIWRGGASGSERKARADEIVGKEELITWAPGMVERRAREALKRDGLLPPEAEGE